MKLTILRRLNFSLLCLLVGFSMAACSGGGGGGSSDQVGTVSVSLTDNSGIYNSVVLSIEKVGVVASNSATTYYNSADISELPVTIDVLDLPDEATLFLGDIEVPLPGDGSEVCFNQFRLVLSEEGNYVIENVDPETKHDLKTPSGQQSGVKLLVKEEAFCLSSDDNAVNLTIEFDPETAIIVKENSTNPYQLKPTSMRIIEGNFFTAPAGFISGVVKVPTPYTNGSCEVLPVPVVTVAAYKNNSEDPTSKTVALTEGPDEEGGSCYYSGGFKLLLPDDGDYDLLATWDELKAETTVASDSTDVVLELE
jgi:hypothetical protein